MDRKVAHLEMIQGVINRMAGNSFSLKGWSVVLVSAIFALAAAHTQILFIYLAYFPSLAFWILDGYFLRQERLFRKLFDRVRALDESAIDFSMDTSVDATHVESWGRVSFSRTVLIFHGSIIGSIVSVMIVMMLIGCN